MPENLLECAFLIPLVRDSDRQPHMLLAWRMLQEALFDLCGGYTGRELVFRSTALVPGVYEEEGTARKVEDQSARYIVAIPETKADELRGILRKAGNLFDQKSIYLSIAGKVEFLMPSAKDGLLE